MLSELQPHDPAALLRQSDYQRDVARVPETFTLILPGGRGSAKTIASVQLVFRHARQYEGSKQLIVRKTYKSMSDVETVIRGLVTALGGSYNGQDRIARLPGGSTIELAQIENEIDYGKLQGKSYSQIVVDECQQYGELRVLDKLNSNLRAAAGVPTRLIYCCNPGGPAHGALAKRFIFRAEPWAPTVDAETGMTFVVCPATYRDNPFIDQERYAAQLRASAAGDPALLKMWLDGDWTAFRGAYFEGTFDPARNVVEPWRTLPTVPGHVAGLALWQRNQLARRLTAIKWNYRLALDHGTSAPGACLLLAESPGDEINGVPFPVGSIVVVDEVVTNAPGSLSEGQGLTVPQTAAKILRMCEAWGVQPWGVADPAIFAKHGHAQGSIADEYERAGVTLEAAPRLDRVGGWELVRRLLSHAAQPDRPGLYISRNCHYLLETLPFAPRDPRRPDDIDSASPDHALDALRYGLLPERTADPGALQISWPH